MEAHLVQGSQEWKSWRNKMIGASDAACILGIGFLTPLQLWEQKLGIREDNYCSPAMQMGLDIEDEAREWFFNETAHRVYPAVFVHDEYKWMHASFDGISDDRKIILEIKKVKKQYHEMAREGKIPEIYYPQLMHQMYVAGLNQCFYLSYQKGDEILLKVDRDDDFINEMVIKELEFKHKVDYLIQPELSEKDYEDLSHDQEIAYLMEMYKRDTEFCKAIQYRIDETKDKIREKIGDRNAKGSGWKMTKYQVQGRIDYDSILRQNNIDVDLRQYRKPGTISYRLTVN